VSIQGLNQADKIISMAKEGANWKKMPQKKGPRKKKYKGSEKYICNKFGKTIVVYSDYNPAEIFWNPLNLLFLIPFIPIMVFLTLGYYKYLNDSKGILFLILDIIIFILSLWTIDISLLIKYFRYKDFVRYDKTTKKPIIKASICTGEQVAGFRDIATGSFEEIMLIKDQEDLASFRAMYGITEEIEKIY